MNKLQALEGEARKAAADARAIIEGVNGGEMTDDQRSQVNALMAKGRDLVDQIKVVKADEAVLAEAKALADLMGPEVKADVEEQANASVGDPRAKGGVSLGRFVVESPQFKSLIKSFGGRIPEQSRVQSDPIQVKSLFTGLSDTSGGAFVVADQSGIVEMLGRKPLTVRDLVSVRRTTSDAVEYVQQTSHTNNAAVVAEATSSAAPTTGASSGAALTLNAGGGYKPEGAWAFVRASAPVRTIAEWVPATKRSLSDVAALEGLINDELRLDIAEAEESEMLAGDGTGEHFDGITHISGTQAQTFSTDIFETTRKAITKAQTIGRVNPTAFVFSPGDTEKIDLQRDNENRFYAGGPFSGSQRTLWGRPYLSSESLSDGTAILADWKKAVLWDREQTTVTMTDSHADFFIRNLVAILAEERAAFAVTRPKAFVIVTTA